MNSFQTKIIVPYYEMNMQREASAATLLNYLEETAIRHSESVGCGIEQLLAEGMGWVLTRWSLHMSRYPRWKETVNLETWPSRFERFYATREFRITGLDGEALGQATSQWVFIDINRKRPVRIPPEITYSYGFNPIRAVEDSFEDLPAPGELESVLPFRVRLSDIDTNDHVNNTRYVEWMLETVPREIQQEYFPAALEVAYKKETGYGTHVLSGIKECAGCAGEKRFLHSINAQDDGIELSRARTIWKKR